MVLSKSRHVLIFYLCTQNLTNLGYLGLSNNKLSGEIPVEIGSMTNVGHLNLLSNELTGEIPSEIGSLMNLTILVLEDNQLSGEIPDSICDIYSNFGILILDNNKLCPPYPSCLTEEDLGEQDTTNCP